VKIKKLSTPIDVGDLPERFRIFRKGANPSSKGTVYFTEQSAKSVMAAFQKQGVDLMIDLEHFSLDGTNPDAMGWCQLAVENGELWAVDVKWNDEGTSRLQSKKQRYISPAFYTDDSDTVTELINVALCAMPATEKAMPLVAASRSVKMEELLKKLAALLSMDEGASEDEIMSALAAKLADDPEEAPAPPPEESTALAALTRQIVALSERIEKSEKRSEADRVSALVDSNLDKIPPALESWARGQNYETLSAFVKSAPAIHKRSATAPARETAVTLTPDEITVAKACGLTVEQFTAGKVKYGAAH
jgi:phage I-like protein